MKYPCKLIQDLLPLYLDGLCSEESKEAVESHLSECSACKELCAAMRESGGVETAPHSAERERQKAASFQTVRRKLFRKQLLLAAAAVAVFVLISLAAVVVLKSRLEVVEYEDNISVSMVDGDLVGRLKGSQESYVRIKRVTSPGDGQEKTYLFFCMSDTKWDALTTGSHVVSEYTLCPRDRGAEQVDAVYYFTGDFTGLESMSREELQTVMDASALLWSK